MVSMRSQVHLVRYQQPLWLRPWSGSRSYYRYSHFSELRSSVPLFFGLTSAIWAVVLQQVDGQSATQKYAGPLDCIRQVYREGGIRSIFRGSLATVARDAPGSAAWVCCWLESIPSHPGDWWSDWEIVDEVRYFVAYEAAKRSLTPEGSDPNQLNLGTVCAAGGEYQHVSHSVVDHPN